MIPVILGLVVITTIVLAVTLDPQVKRCEHCHGPVTLRELLGHMKRCSGGEKPEGKT